MADFDRADNRSALESTLAALEIPTEGAAVVALCRTTAERLDTMPLHIDAYAAITNAYLKQLAELRHWLPMPDVSEVDPFDELARRLHTGDAV